MGDRDLAVAGALVSPPDPGEPVRPGSTSSSIIPREAGLGGQAVREVRMSQCIGRSDRSRLVAGDHIAPDKRRVMVRNTP
jgi:hypothetical protein